MFWSSKEGLGWSERGRVVGDGVREGIGLGYVGFLGL